MLILAEYSILNCKVVAILLIKSVGFKIPGLGGGGEGETAILEYGVRNLTFFSSFRLLFKYHRLINKLY